VGVWLAGARWAGEILVPPLVHAGLCTFAAF
jgi:hypothetical protein